MRIGKNCLVLWYWNGMECLSWRLKCNTIQVWSLKHMDSERVWCFFKVKTTTLLMNSELKMICNTNIRILDRTMPEIPNDPSPVNKIYEKLPSTIEMLPSSSAWVTFFQRSWSTTMQRKLKQWDNHEWSLPCLECPAKWSGSAWAVNFAREIRSVSPSRPFCVQFINFTELRNREQRRFRLELYFIMGRNVEKTPLRRELILMFFSSVYVRNRNDAKST